MRRIENKLQLLKGINLFIFLIFSQYIIAQDFARFDFEDESGVSTTLEKISGSTFSINNHFRCLEYEENGCCKYTGCL